jgi:SNF2 family DNA or RNA helicase
MEWVPHQYQEKAISLLLSQASAGLLLDPGLGKTAISLASFLILKEQGLAKKMLVIAPLRPMQLTWPSEIKKWDTFNGITFSIVHGKDKQEALDQDTDLYLINPEGLDWLYKSGGFSRHKFDILCVDESTKFKAHSTKRFKLLKENLDRFNRRWILTGTPVPNGLMDLFGQIYILDFGRALGRYITHYRNRFFFNPNPFDPYTWAGREGAFEEITERIAPLVLRLKAEDYLDMPELIDVDIPVELPPEAMEKYKAIEDDFILQLGTDTIVASNAAVAGGKCRQICNGAIYFTDDIGERDWKPIHDEKLDALEDLLDELNGAPTLVLYEFNHDRERIEQRLGELPSFTGVTDKKQQKLIDDFNAGKIRTLIGHPGSIGHGLNLQGACSHVIWFGLTWNLEHYDQAIARIYRQGQTAERVFNYRIFAKSTLDERVAEALGKKTSLQDTLLEELQKRGT